MHQEHRQLNHPTRLGIFVFYDPQGVVDRYVDYLLRDLSENLTDLVIVCNGALDAPGEAVLRTYTDRLYRRENTGFDAAAWKYAMTEALGWEFLAQYDELVLLNDTFFGPFVPFAQIFEEMVHRDVDFWGITGHGRVESEKLPKCPYSYLPAHIQSYFCVIRRAMHTALAFRAYWEAQPVYRSFSEVVGGNEVTFTQHFADLGFRWCTYMDFAALDAKIPCNQSILMPYDLLRRGCPILKRKCFSTYQASHGGNLLNTQTGLALQYIKCRTDYPVEFIYETILRLYNLADVYDNLHLNYILPTEHSATETVQNCRAAVVVQLHSLCRLDEKRSYLQKVPRWMDILVMTDTEEEAMALQDRLTSEFVTRLRILSSSASADKFLFSVDGPCASGQYELLCFCLEANPENNSKLFFKSLEQSWWDNLLASEAYIQNIVTCFQENDRLGLLVPPWPYAEPGNQMWANSFETVYQLAERLQLTVPISQDRPSLSVGMAFWCRTAALAPLVALDWQQKEVSDTGLEGDFPGGIIGRILPFVAQQSGYYTGWVMTQENASANLCGLREFAVSGNVRKILKNVLRKRLSPGMWKFCKRLYYIFQHDARLIK